MTERTRNTLIITLVVVFAVVIPFILFPVLLINSTAPRTRELVVADLRAAECTFLDDGTHLLTVPVVGTEDNPLSIVEFDSTQGIEIVRLGVVPADDKDDLLGQGGTSQLVAQAEGPQRLGYFTTEPSVIAMVIDADRTRATASGLTIKTILGEVNSKQQIGLRVAILDGNCSVASTSGN